MEDFPDGSAQQTIWHIRLNIYVTAGNTITISFSFWFPGNLPEVCGKHASETWFVLMSDRRRPQCPALRSDVVMRPVRSVFAYIHHLSSTYEAPSGCCSPDESAAQNKHKSFIRGVNGKVGVYDPNYHLCFSAYFNHSHILFSRSTLQSLPLQHPTHTHTYAQIKLS